MASRRRRKACSAPVLVLPQIEYRIEGERFYTHHPFPPVVETDPLDAYDFELSCPRKIPLFTDSPTLFEDSS
jgi:hypothetical protein